MEKGKKVNLANLFIKFLYLSSAGFLAFYSIFSIWNNRMYLPRKYGGYQVFVEEGLWLFALAFICGAINILCMFLNYNMPEKKSKYKLLKRITFYLGWTLFISALVVDLFIFPKSIRI